MYFGRLFRPIISVGMPRLSGPIMMRCLAQQKSTFDFVFSIVFLGGDIVYNQPAYQPYSLRCGGEVVTGKSGRYEKKVYVFGFFCVTL